MRTLRHILIGLMLAVGFLAQAGFSPLPRQPYSSATPLVNAEDLILMATQ